MLSIIADTHTHTVACDHAYSTISENAARAKEVGLEFLAMTEHAPAMPGGPSKVYFNTLGNLPRAINGVTLLKGVELNIIDYEGSVDLPDQVIEGMEWVIASYHLPCIRPADAAAHTRGWLRIAENPHIDVIGHCGDPRYAFELDPVMRAFKEHGKIVEINAHSFTARRGSREKCREIARACAELGVPVVVNSDSHFHMSVGEFGAALELLEEISFPEELVLNADHLRFVSAAAARAPAN